MNIVRPSLSLLPIDDIAAELKSNKANRKFMTKEDNASDVDQVGGIDAKRIAISAEGHDRQTVENALKLNGKLAEDYVTKEDGEKFLEVSNVLSEMYSKEIRNLRDELYSLYSELTKKGFIGNNVKYEGFVEGFNKGDKQYVDYICGIATQVVGRAKDLFIADPSASHYFEEGQTFVIRRSDTDEEQVVTSLGINQGCRVSFEPAVNFLDSVDKVGLFKTTGEYINSTFSFSEIKKSVSEQTERYYSQSDDTDTKYLTIKKANTGYAAVFKVPRSIKSQRGIAGALSKFAVRAQAINNPGALKCHVVDFDAIYSDGQLNPKFDNINDAIKKGYVIASSDMIYPTRDNSSMENDIYFDFNNGVHKSYANRVEGLDSQPDGEISFLNDVEESKSNGLFETADNYPILKDTKYCFIIESLGATEESYWRLRFSYFNNSGNVDDLHRRNASYIYSAIDSSGIIGDEKCIKIIDDISKYDIIYTLVIKDIVEEEEVGKQEGVYTARIVLPKPINISRARLTMRVNREGMYNIKDHNSSYTIFNLESDTATSHSSSDTRLKIGDKVAIGNTIATIKRVSTTEIETVAPVYLDERIIKYYTTSVYNQESNSYEEKTNIPVYRLNYTPKIKARLVDWEDFNEALNKFNSTSLELKDLELVSIVPDKYKEDKRVSDRLLYEADFEDQFVNEFELQINWASPFSAREINEVKDLKDKNFKELIGRIHNLVLSFDNHY